MLNKTLVPAILLIAIVVGGIFIYQDNKAITNLNNTVAKLQTGELPLYELEIRQGQKDSYKAKDIVISSAYEVIRLINQATSTNK